MVSVRKSDAISENVMCSRRRGRASTGLDQEIVIALRAKIDSWGIGQERAALRLNVSRSYLCMILNNSRHVSLDRLIELARDAGLYVTLDVVDPGRSRGAPES